jgi:hypothetical protein
MGLGLVLMVLSSCGPLRVEGELNHKVEVNVGLISQQLIEVCNTAYEDYEGEDKDELIKVCTENQIEVITALVESMLPKKDASQ